MKKIKIVLFLGISLFVTLTYLVCSLRNQHGKEYNHQPDFNIVIQYENEVEREAKKLKTTQQRIQALYNKNSLIRDAGLKSLADNLDPISVKPIIDLLKDKERTWGMWFLEHANKILLSFKQHSIPLIINELKDIVEKIPDEDEFLVRGWERKLNEAFLLPLRYVSTAPNEDRKSALQWWIKWWERCKDIPEVYWRKEAIKINQQELDSPNYIAIIEAIKNLRRLTGLGFSEVIVSTPPHKYPTIRDRKDFKDYPTGDDLKKWQEWFDKYGEIDKWEKWINENYDYLYWSKDQKYFVVNEEAKAKGIPVDPESGQMILPRNKQ